MQTIITHCISRQKAFTLIEILLVMLITSILILGIHAAYRQANLICSNIESYRPIYHSVRTITETLRAELACLYFPQLPQEEENSSFDLSTLPDGTVQLVFYTLNPSWFSGLESSRIAKVRYSSLKDNDSDKMLLKRSEQYCAGEKIIGKEISDTLSENLSDFRLLALDPNSDLSEDSWKQSYNSKTAPPKALKILLKWPEAKNIPATDFQTCITIPCELQLSH